MDLPRNFNKKWTEEEDNILIENWGIWDIKTFCKELGRTVSGIRKRGKVLQLGSPMYQNYFTIGYIAKQLGKDRRTLMGYGFKITRKTFKTKKYELVTLENLMKWLKNNQDLYYAKNIPEYAFGIEPKWLVEKRKNENIEKIYRSKRKYTKVEDSNMISMFKMGISLEQIGIELNRKPEGIRKRLYNIGVIKPKCKCVKWSKKEDERLKYLVFETDLSLDDIADDLMRSKIAIKTRLTRKFNTCVTAIRCPDSKTAKRKKQNIVGQLNILDGENTNE